MSVFGGRLSWMKSTAVHLRVQVGKKAKWGKSSNTSTAPWKHQMMWFSFCCRICLKYSDRSEISKLSMKFVLTLSTRLLFVCAPFTLEYVGLSRPQRTGLCGYFSFSTCRFYRIIWPISTCKTQTQVFFYLPAICQDLGNYQSPSLIPSFISWVQHLPTLTCWFFRWFFGQKQHLRLSAWGKEVAGRCCQGTK